MYYGRDRDNYFGIPQSVTQSVNNDSNNLLKLDSYFSNQHCMKSRTDINSKLTNLFSSNEMRDVCLLGNRDKFLEIIMNEGILVRKPQEVKESVYSSGWYTSDAYVATEVLLMYGVSVAAFVAVVGVVMGRPNDSEEENLQSTIFLQKHLKNPILKVLSNLARLLGSVDFGKTMHELFYELENGQCKIYMKEEKIYVGHV